MKQKNYEKNSDYNKIIAQAFNSINKKKFNEAQEYFLEAIKIDKKNYVAYINLSNLYLIKNDTSSSINCLFDFLKKNGFNYSIANHISKVCAHFNLNKDFDNLLKMKKFKNVKHNKYIYYFEGIINEKNNLFHEATISYNRAILCDKYFFDPYLKFINLLESKNEINPLEKYINKATKIFHKQKNIYYIYFYKSLFFYRKKKYKKSEQIIAQYNLEKKLISSNDYTIRLLDLRSKNLERLNKFNKSFSKIVKRNRLIKLKDENKNFDENKIINTISNYKNFYKQENIKTINKKLNYSDSLNLVFLVGFPRSGTTLLDTILRTHSKITVLEEKPYLLNLRHEYFEKNNNNLLSLKRLNQKDKDHIVQKYFDLINLPNKSNKKVIIDKLPLSIIELGFIKCIFPKAKIILALRHPCDVVISCFFSLFKMNDAMINFLNLDNTIDFYHRVFDLFDSYEKELELNIHKIKYENVVLNFEESISNLLNFMNLDYERNLKEFNITAKSREKISTPSYSQVVNPLYSSSIGRWKKFSIKKELEIKLGKWIKKFNY